MKKSALILSPFFYPENISTGKYNSFLVQELVRVGYTVDVWCSHPVYPSWVVTESVDKMDGVSILRGGRSNVYPSNVVGRRAVLEFWYALFVLKNLFESRKVFDVAISILPPSLFTLCMPIFRHKYRKNIGIVHDLQGVYSGIGAGFLKSQLSKLIGFVEKKAFRRCEHIVYLSRAMADAANEMYGIDRTKTSVHYPFVTTKEFVDRGNLADIFPSDKLHLVYSGALGEKQNSEGLLSLFLAVVAVDVRFVAHVFSAGPIYESMKSAYRVDRLNFHDLVDEVDLPELLLRSDVQVVPQLAGSASGSLPSKLPNLLASRVKIFCITDEGSELIEILREHLPATVVTSWDIEDNTRILAGMLKGGKVEVRTEPLMSKFSVEDLVATITEEAVK